MSGDESIQTRQMTKRGTNLRSINQSFIEIVAMRYPCASCISQVTGERTVCTAEAAFYCQPSPKRTVLALPDSFDKNLLFSFACKERESWRGAGRQKSLAAKGSGHTPSTKCLQDARRRSPHQRNNVKILLGNNGVSHASITTGKSATV